MKFFTSNNNNYANFDYNYLNQVLLKTKKLTKYTTGEYILFSKNNLIFMMKREILLFIL